LISAPFFEPDPIRRVSWPSLAGNWPKTQIKIIFSITYTKR
jgi:hypothetical protein